MRKYEISSVVNVLKLVASIAYLFMGIYILSNPDILKTLGVDIPKNFANALGIVLIAYGLLRLFRVYQAYKSNNEDNSEQDENE